MDANDCWKANIIAIIGRLRRESKNNKLIDTFTQEWRIHQKNENDKKILSFFSVLLIFNQKMSLIFTKNRPYNTYIL